MKQSVFRGLLFTVLLLFMSGCLKSHNSLNDTVTIRNNQLNAAEIQFTLSDRTYGYTINTGLSWEITGVDEIVNAVSVVLMTNDVEMFSGNGTQILELFEKTQINDDETSYHYAYELILED